MIASIARLVENPPQAALRCMGKQKPRPLPRKRGVPDRNRNAAFKRKGHGKLSGIENKPRDTDKVKFCVTGTVLLTLKREVELDRADQTRRKSANRLFHSRNRNVSILPGRITMYDDVIIVFYRRALGDVAEENQAGADRVRFVFLDCAGITVHRNGVRHQPG